MQPSRTPSSLLLIAGLCALLAACGGGDDCPPAVDPPTDTLPDLSDCFTVKPGLRYTMTDTDPEARSLHGEYLVETFDGTPRQAQVDYFGTTGGKRFLALYWSVEPDGLRFWGDYDHTPEGVQTTKSVYTGFLVPRALAPTQTVTIHFTDNNYFTNGHFLPEEQQETWTFEGHETLALAGRTFTNACRIRTSIGDHPEYGSTTMWVAPGFGPIQYQSFDADGKVDSLSKLDTVTVP
jgi:hypothetical protein